MKLELTGSLTDALGTMNADELTTLVASRSPSPGTPSIVPASGDRDAVVDLIAVLAVGGCAVPVDPQSSAEDQAELATRLGLSSGYDMPDLTSTALVLSSSGSNGRPKLVRHSLDSALVGVAVYRQRFGITPDDVVLLAVPWCHSFGLIAGLLTAVSSGARVVVLPRITPPAVHEAVARENATVLLCTPLLVDLLVRTASAASYRGLRVAISSGSPLSASRRDAFESRFGWQGQGVGKVGGWGCLSWFDGGGVSLGRGRGPRRDDEWCLINPFVLGARADVIFHHDRLVAPAPGPGSQEHHRPTRQARCAS